MKSFEVDLKAKIAEINQTKLSEASKGLLREINDKAGGKKGLNKDFSN